MENREKLCRIFYIDVMFWVYTWSKYFIKENLKQEFIRIKKESEKPPISDIKKRVMEVDPRYLSWYNQLENKQFTNKSIKVEKLIIEAAHNNLDGVINCKGKRIIDFLKENRNNQRVLERLDFVSRNFEIINQFLPIIVRQINDDTFEVMFGNHRVMAYIEKGYSEIEVIVISEK